MVVVERLVASSEHPLCNIGTPFDVMWSINKDLRLYNWDQAILLADDCVAGQPISI